MASSSFISSERDSEVSTFCLGCGCDTTTIKGNRLLRTAASRHVVSLWSSLMEEEFRSKGISLPVQLLVDRDGRMCRQCFATFERASKMWVGIKGGVSKAANVLFPKVVHSATGALPLPKRPRIISNPALISAQQSPEVKVSVYKELFADN